MLSLQILLDIGQKISGQKSFCQPLPSTINDPGGKAARVVGTSRDYKGCYSMFRTGEWNNKQRWSVLAVVLYIPRSVVFISLWLWRWVESAFGWFCSSWWWWSYCFYLLLCSSCRWIERVICGSWQTVVLLFVSGGSPFVVVVEVSGGVHVSIIRYVCGRMPPGKRLWRGLPNSTRWRLPRW